MKMLLNILNEHNKTNLVKKRALRRVYTMTIVILLISIVSLVNLSINSFALWYETNNQVDNNLISTGCFNIAFNDLAENNKSSSIGLLNTYPIKDSVGVKLQPYSFTIKNICNITGEYRIVLSKLSNSNLANEYLRYTFNKKDDILVVDAIPTESTTVLDNNTVAIINQKNNPNYIVDNYVLEEGYIEPNEELSYELRIWLNENAGNDQMGKIFEGVVSVSSIASS